MVNRITAAKFACEVDVEKDTIIDVRKESEYEAEHVEEAFSKPLAYINEWVDSLPKDEKFYLHCAGGYRSIIAASILQARGIRNFIEIEGGFGAISATNLPTTDFVCQSKVISKR